MITEFTVIRIVAPGVGLTRCLTCGAAVMIDEDTDSTAANNAMLTHDTYHQARGEFRPA